MLGKDILVVLSDSGKLSFLTFSNEMHRFFSLQFLSVSIYSWPRGDSHIESFLVILFAIYIFE